MDLALTLMENYGVDPQVLARGMEFLHHFLNLSLPAPPVYTDAWLSASDDDSHGGAAAEDRISALPDNLLRAVVSRLPANDAARTAALSSRWRRLWLSVPLTLVDTHLVPPCSECPPPRGSSYAAAVIKAVSRVLETHPGPFRCVDLSCSSMDEHCAELARWIHLLAIKGVQELVFINRPRPMALPLPATVFALAPLSRLYLAFWRFPDTAALPRGAAFPHLRELGLCSVAMEDRDLDFVLARSPFLELLGVLSSQRHVVLRLASHSLRCVQLCMSVVEDIAVVDAPRLERLLSIEDGGEVRTRFSFGHAPNLRLLGYLRPGIHVLEIGNTIIKAGTMASPRTVVPSVNVLALKVHFEVRNEAKMLPSFLRCFPNVETLHIESEKTDEPAGKLSLKFWQEAGRIECLQSCIKRVVFHGYRGEGSELAFLKFILGNAPALQEMLIVLAIGIFSLWDEVDAKLMKTLDSLKMANEECSVALLESTIGQGCSSWCFRQAFDFSVSDTFDIY